MEPSTASILLAFLVPFFLLSLYSFRLSFANHHQNKHKLPPGPRPLPIIGNLHQLGKLPHRCLHCLAKTYGPIMFFRLGSRPMVMISSSKAAELVLKTHDNVFSSRLETQVMHHIWYGKSMAFAENGAYWRSMKKLCSIQLLSPSKVEFFAPIRKEELQWFVKRMKVAAAAREVVDMRTEVGKMIGDIACRIILGCTSRERYHLKGVIHEALNLVGAFNIADYIRILGALDLQGLSRRANAVNRVIDQVLEDIIKEHEQDTGARYKGDFVDTLLSIMNEPMQNSQNDLGLRISRTEVKAIILDMITGSFESPSVAIEWALAELMRNPRAMRLLQEELETTVGRNRPVEEQDLPKLSYLDMVVRESLRLHPPLPLLIPHVSTEDVDIGGYYIPKRAQVVVNAWAIGRDVNVWGPNAEEFYPERFADSGVDVKGRDFQLLPFGSGRRSCPGMGLGLITIQLVLAQLVHCFDWALPEGVAASELDMSEEFGLSLPRARHLLLVPSCRLHVQV